MQVTKSYIEVEEACQAYLEKLQAEEYQLEWDTDTVTVGTFGFKVRYFWFCLFNRSVKDRIAFEKDCCEKLRRSCFYYADDRSAIRSSTYKVKEIQECLKHIESDRVILTKEEFLFLKDYFK